MHKSIYINKKQGVEIGIGNVSNRNKEQQVRIRNYAVGILTLSAFHKYHQAQCILGSYNYNYLYTIKKCQRTCKI